MLCPFGFEGVVYAHAFSVLRQRIADWRRERRIHALLAAVNRAGHNHDTERMWALARVLFAECDKRSPQQIARMEQAMLDRLDPHARATFEQSKGADRA